MVERRSPKPEVGGSSPSWPAIDKKCRQNMNIKQKIVTYYEETVVELKKVTWPTKDEVRGSTVVVVITSIILSAFVFAVDRLLSFVVGSFLS
jgi:preprotein translocase subunit SecE